MSQAPEQYVDADSQRIELRDPSGRVRVVLGNLASSEGNYWPGVELLDAAGVSRASLVLLPDGPMLGFGVGGDTALELGVNDEPGGSSTPSVFVRLSDRDGTVVKELEAPFVSTRAGDG